MFRNNKDRLGVEEDAEKAQTPPTQPPENQQSEPEPEPVSRPMTFVVPTEFVDLPSEGKFYPADHPLHGVENVEIKFMTAKEEDILTSKSLLKKGLTINRLLSSVVVDKRANPDDLLVGDRNALLVATRISGYGPEYKTKVLCPACFENVSYEFDLTEMTMFSGGENEVNDTVKQASPSTFYVTMPISTAKVEFRLLTGRDEKQLAKIAEMQKKKNMPESSMTNMMRMFIVSVNDSSDQHYIDSFVAASPASDAKFLRQAYKRTAPNVDLTQEFNCSSCGHSEELEVPFSTDFFWPK
jgi:hypothetical protein